MPVARCTASGNFRRVRGREADQRRRRIAPACRPTRMPTARVRIDQLAGRPEHLRHGGAGLLLAGARGIEQLSRAAERVGRHRELAGAAANCAIRPRTSPPSRSHRSNSRRSKLLATWMSMLGLMVGWTCAGAVVAAREEARQDVVAVGRDDQLGDRQADLRRDVAGIDVAEIAGRHGERDPCARARRAPGPR